MSKYDKRHDISAEAEFTKALAKSGVITLEPDQYKEVNIEVGPWRRHKTELPRAKRSFTLLRAGANRGYVPLRKRLSSIVHTDDHSLIWYYIGAALGISLLSLLASFGWLAV